ncbi:MAG: AAA family ATPase [Terriglobales bacterium]
MKTAADVAERLGARRSGDGWLARCPAHDDRSPSLAIAEGAGGRTLVYCHAGCAYEAIRDALARDHGITLGGGDRGPAPSHTATYTDPHGVPLYQVRRWDGPGGKRIRQYRADGKGGWTPGLDGVTRTLYHLPDVVVARQVVIVEGEVKCDALRAAMPPEWRGAMAVTTAPGGAGKWRAEYSPLLAGRDVVVLPDADGPGRAHAASVSASVRPYAHRLGVVDLHPGAADGSDVADWLAAGHTIPELRALVAATPEWRPAAGAAVPATPWAAAEGMDALLAGDDADQEWLVPGVLAPSNLTEIFAPRGLGKSLLADFWAVTLGRAGKRVLILDRDNPRHTLRARLRGFGAEGITTIKALDRGKCPPLTKPHEWALFPYAEYDVVIVDALDSMAEGVGEQDSSRPAQALVPLLDICHRDGGPAVLLLGNTVKAATHSRGSGVVEDRADIVYEVRDATGFRPTGAKPWIEELSPQGADAWAARSGRRKGREVYRLAMVCTKFRVGEEPDPFVLEISTAADPWTVMDVTSQVDAAGEDGRRARASAQAEALAASVAALRAEIERRVAAGEPEMHYRDAQAFLVAGGRRRKDARRAIEDAAFERIKIEGRGNPTVIRAAGKNGNGGTKEARANTAKTAAETDSVLCRPHEQGAAQISGTKTQHNRCVSAGAFCAAPFPDTTPGWEAQIE